MQLSPLFWKERIILRESFVIWCLCLLALNIVLKSQHVGTIFFSKAAMNTLGLPGHHEILLQNLSQQRPCDHLKAIPK